jgi:hypothetical protein
MSGDLVKGYEEFWQGVSVIHPPRTYILSSQLDLICSGLYKRPYLRKDPSAGKLFRGPRAKRVIQ